MNIWGVSIWDVNIWDVNICSLFIWDDHSSIRTSLTLLTIALLGQVYTFFFGSILTGNGGNGQHADEVNMVRLALRLSPSSDDIVLGQKEDEQGGQEDENNHHEPDQILIQKCPHTLKFKSTHFLRNQQQLK